MGQFLNPGNEAFQSAVNSQIYVDKTGLLAYTNAVSNTSQAFICNSRPRRFGKSYTADMLTAYYSRGCDSSELFSHFAISREEGYREHLNQYDVIHLDVQWFLTTAVDVDSIVEYMSSCVLDELRDEFPEVRLEEIRSLPFALSAIHAKTGRRFVVIIDEWDVLIRDEAANSRIQEEYIRFLRGMFKGSEPSKFIQLAWLTGILPIKRLKTQSALNNFLEYTMISPGPLASYIGFTESEVQNLCHIHGMNFDEVKRWYDGYQLGQYHVYNPNAVVKLMTNRTFQSYWSSTGTYESIVPIINRNFDGLKTAVIDMLSGNNVDVNVNTFQNDMVSFANRDDVMTLLIHLGYLAYDFSFQKAYIPNEEIRQELLNAVNAVKWTAYDSFLEDSENLLDATLDMDEQKVAAGIEKIHEEYASQIKYNDENSLSSVLTIGYLATLKYYFRPVRELPTGRGFADFIYLPKPVYLDAYPALVVELKWNQSVSTALQQIREKHYPETIRQYTGDILLVGINYDKKTKEHTCRIEKVEKQ